MPPRLRLSSPLSATAPPSQMDTDQTELPDDTENPTEEQPQGASSSKSVRNPVKSTRKKRKDYWDSFTTYFDEEGKKRARCNYCPKINYVCDSNTNGNKNVKRHYERCPNHPNNQGKGTQSKLILQNVGDGGVKMKNWTFDEKHIREYVCRMVIRDEMSFRSVERDGMIDAFYAAQPAFDMPSRTTVARDCLRIYVRERENLKRLLKTSCQSVCVTTDTWTSTATDNYTCVTVHWIDDDWKLQKRIINFVLTTCHKGGSIARTLDDCLRYWDLSRKLLTVTVDNAPANDVACACMGEISRDNGCIGKGEFVKVRCIAHIINLTVQDALKACGDHVKKVRAIVKYFRGSPPRKELLRQQVERLNIKCNSFLVNDVSTRWNSTYLMLSSALKYKSAFARMHIPVDDELGPMTASDWSRIEKLCNFLEEFYDLTNRISGSSYVTSNWMIVHVALVGKLVRELMESDDDELQQMAFQMSLKFEKYFGTFDKMNLLMFVPAILDPLKKLQCVAPILKTLFPLQDPEMMVKKVKDVAYALFDEFRSLHSPPDEGGSQSRQPVTKVSANSSWSRLITALEVEGPDCVDKNLRSEFDQYLAEIERPEAAGKMSIMEWWSVNQHRYPVLAQMARAVLAIPITTVPSESAFSTGRRVISDYRASLSAEKVQALVCTQDWLRGTSLKHAHACEDTLIEELEDDTLVGESQDPELAEGTFYICMD